MVDVSGTRYLSPGFFSIVKSRSVFLENIETTLQSQTGKGVRGLSFKGGIALGHCMVSLSYFKKVKIERV